MGRLTVFLVFCLFSTTVHNVRGGDIQNSEADNVLVSGNDTDSTTTKATSATTTTVVLAPGNTSTTVPTTAAPTTTATPSTATTAAPITTAAPSNATSDMVKFFVRGANNTVCILLKAKIQMVVNYTNVNNTAKQVSLQVMNDSTVHGDCGDGKKPQTLTFTPFKDWDVTLTFNKSKDGISLILVQANYTLTKSLIPDLLNEVTNQTHLNQTMYKTLNDEGFYCNSELPITFPNSTHLVEMTTTQLQVEAFRTNNSTDFGSEYTQCEADNKISNIVPIAVGAALGALVLIVLIAYLVGRKRNQRGYESV